MRPHIREQNRMQKITPFLWFDDQAEGAVNFYISIFKKSKIVNVARYGEERAKDSLKNIVTYKRQY